MDMICIKRIFSSMAAAAALGMIILLGCAGTGPADQGTSQKVFPSDEKYPAPVEVSGLIDFSDAQYGHLWNTLPDGGAVKFFAAVPRMMYRENEIDAAMDQAALQAVMFVSTVHATSRYLSRVAGREQRFREEVRIDYDRSLVSAMKSRLNLVYHYRDRDGTYILAELPNVRLPGVAIDRTVRNGYPSWVFNMPDITGYKTGIGVIMRSRYFADSLTNADEQALANITRQVFTDVKSRRIDYAAGRDTHISGEVQLEIAEAAIRGFYILDRWQSPDGQYYYSLAVVPK